MRFSARARPVSRRMEQGLHHRPGSARQSSGHPAACCPHQAVTGRREPGGGGCRAGGDHHGDDHGGTLSQLAAPGGLATFADNLTGMLGTYLALVMVLLVSRIPFTERVLGRTGCCAGTGGWPVTDQPPGGARSLHRGGYAQAASAVSAGDLTHLIDRVAAAVQVDRQDPQAARRPPSPLGTRGCTAGQEPARQRLQVPSPGDPAVPHARPRGHPGSNGGVGYSNCLNAPPGRQSPATQSLLFLDALEESPSDHLDPPADGSSIRREDSRDLPGHTAAVWRHGTLSRPCRDLLTCGFSLG